MKTLLVGDRVRRGAGDTGRDGSRETRGLLMTAGAFLICPCHLPLTLALLAAALGGTAAGAVLGSHVVLAGVLISTVWLVLTARGVWLVRAGRRGAACPVPPARR